MIEMYAGYLASRFAYVPSHCPIDPYPGDTGSMTATGQELVAFVHTSFGCVLALSTTPKHGERVLDFQGLIESC